jgi:hypothetical protein
MFNDPVTDDSDAWELYCRFPFLLKRNNKLYDMQCFDTWMEIHTRLILKSKNQSKISGISRTKIGA